VGLFWPSCGPNGDRLHTTLDMVGHMLNVFAVDPGHSTGGLAHITGSGLTIGAYKKMPRKSGAIWRLTLDLPSVPIQVTEHLTLWGMMDHTWGVLKPARYVLVVEQPFIPRGRLAGLTKLIESSGGWCATLAPGALTVCRPTANAWRKSILGIDSRVPAKVAEQMCIDWASQYDVRSMCANGHACEALAMAHYAQSLLG